MKPLRIEQFAEFFKAVHGVEPFPWQRRLVAELAQSRRWPQTIDLPTGAGKTAVLDVAIFLLALEADRPDRSAPIRTVMTVDRRTIVDQAYERALRMQRALSDGDGCTAIQAVRERLASLSGDGIPLQVTMLRGGVARDDSWARSPDQPTLVLSTVDQVGSRLFFRGYGVSASMRPIHAGLLGNDCLLILDEVHLSEAWRETLAVVAGRYRQWVTRPLPDRWQVVAMSATPGQRDPSTSFELDERDRSHAVLRRRLEAGKPVRLVECTAHGGTAAREAMARTCARLAIEAGGDGRTVAVVVNRVLTAHAVADRLEAELQGRADVCLVTGRMRPLDRAAVEIELKERAGSGRRCDPEARALFVVATQCIEAGADLDFDFLVTECASLDALRQRFGRLNRLGDRPDAEGAIVLAPDASEEDPVYGPALVATWHHLRRQTSVNFGLTRLPLPEPQAMEALLPPKPLAPVLLPAHLDAWAQTSPAPDPDPDVSLWLHGVRDAAVEVQVAWRADIVPDSLSAALEGGGGLAQRSVLERLEVCPPSVAECVSVPMVAARRWLLLEPAAFDFGDVEGQVSEEPTRRGSGRSRPFVLWRGDDSVVADDTRAIRPGDLIVVPATYGGLNRGSWLAEAAAVVADLGDRARFDRQGRPVLRLHSGVLGSAFADGLLPDALSGVPKPVDLEDAEEERSSTLTDYLEKVEAHDKAGWLGVLARHLTAEFASRRPPEVVQLQGVAGADGEYLAIVGRRPAISRAPTLAALDTSTEDDTASLLGGEVTLLDHLQGVRGYAEELCRRCALPRDLSACVVAAASWHDLGKADPRFQVLLHGGSEFRARTADGLLAKSSHLPEDRRRRDLARQRAHYPKGYRHEVLSAALLQTAPDLLTTISDPDLVLHLVTAHHGHGRPLVPVVHDPEPVQVHVELDGRNLAGTTDHGLDRLDSGVCDRYWMLVRRYGWWGLAWLEAILRLADHRRSAAEQAGLTGGTR